MTIKEDPFTVVWFSPHSAGLTHIQSIFTSYAWTTTTESLHANHNTLNTKPIILFDLAGFKENSIQKIHEISTLLPHIPIIAIAENNTYSTLAEEAVEKGADDFYLGPLNSNLLRKRINTLIQHNKISDPTHIKDKSPSVELAFMAFYDELTGLSNRKHFFNRLEECIKSQALDTDFIALLYIDLDGFKSINDTHTHKAGDWLLQQVAMRLRNCVKRSDTVARMGGDEFSIFINNISETGIVSNIAQRILYNLSAPFFYNGKQLRIHSSIGIALYPHNASSSHELLERADQTMYAVKQMGRGNYRFYSDISHTLENALLGR